jgi:pimeloyl-ACP methyl ester carboxylesterase
MKTKIITKILYLLVSIVLTSCGGSEPDVIEESVFGIDKAFEAKTWSGEYKVATTTYSWQDDSREEPHTPASNDFREVQVRLFYPTDQEYTENRLSVLPAEFWQREGAEQVITGKKLRPSNYSNRSWYVELNAAISDNQQTYPLIIFSNGYGFTPEIHVSISAELASRGYIVASINHPYGSGVTKLLSGNTVHAQSLPDDNLGIDLKLWSDDQLFALNQLENVNFDTESVIFGRLDQRIGTMGHSYGGAAAYYSAWQDDRVRAAINLDGTIFNSENKNINQPFMYMQNDNGYDHDIFEQVNNDGYAVVFQNQIRHHSFADYVLFWAWDFPVNKPFGPMDSQAALLLISDLTEQFFDRYFDGDTAPLLDGETAPPEGIKITKF